MTDIKQYEPLWGSWYVDSLLGEGSYGKVYKVHKDEFGKRYEAAVKIISIPQSEAELRQAQSDGMDAASARSYFHAFVTDIIQEIDLMNAFKGSSNIVSLEDHEVIEHKDEIGWDILIRMELLSTLSSRVTEKPMTRDDVVKLGVHVCRALELCAVRNTIHRDIKPDNIFVSQYGDYKLGDFGIARQIERTMSGLSKKGTYTYMAPEVFKGEDYGASVDIYSLGIVMYRFLNKNRVPFLPVFPDPITPHDREESLRRRMSGEAIPPIDGVDHALNDIVLKACAYDRSDRFKDASEMRAALESLCGGDILTRPTAAPFSRPAFVADDRTVSARDEATAAAFGKEDVDATVGIFSAVPEEARKIDDLAAERIGISASAIFKISLLDAVSFAILCALTFFSGRKSDIFTFFPVYVFCAAQCFLKFKNAIANGAFLLVLASFLVISVCSGFRSLDYNILIFTSVFVAIFADDEGRGSPRARVFVCASLVALAAASIYAMRSGVFYLDASRGLAVPFVLFASSPLALLFAANRKCALVLIGALMLFMPIVFIIYAATGHPAFFYVADANFTGFSPYHFVWWRAARFVGLMIQNAAFAMLVLQAWMTKKI